MKIRTKIGCCLTVLMLVMPFSVAKNAGLDNHKNKIEITAEELESLKSAIQEIKKEDPKLHEKMSQVLHNSVTKDDEGRIWLNLNEFEKELNDVQIGRTRGFGDYYFILALIKGTYKSIEENPFEVKGSMMLIGPGAYDTYPGPVFGFFKTRSQHIYIYGLFVGICNNGYINGIGCNVNTWDYHGSNDNRNFSSNDKDKEEKEFKLFQNEKQKSNPLLNNIFNNKPSFNFFQPQNKNKNLFHQVFNNFKLKPKHILSNPLQNVFQNINTPTNNQQNNTASEQSENSTLGLP